MAKLRVIIFFLLCIIGTSLSQNIIKINETVQVSPVTYNLYDLFSNGLIEYNITDLTKSSISVYVTKRIWISEYGLSQYYSSLSCLNQGRCLLKPTNYNSTEEVVLLIYNNNIIQDTRVRVYINNRKVDIVSPDKLSIYMIGILVLISIVVITVILIGIFYIYKIMKRKDESQPLIQV